MKLFSFFFFSSRRRHTRWPRDWSSDVCSSDLERKNRGIFRFGWDADALAVAGTSLLPNVTQAARNSAEELFFVAWRGAAVIAAGNYCAGSHKQNVPEGLANFRRDRKSTRLNSR